MIITNRANCGAARGIPEDAAALDESRRARSESNALSVLILDGESPYALSIARCLAAARVVRTHVLSSWRWAPVRFSRSIESFHSWSGFKGVLASEECSNVAREVGADLCLATDEVGIEFTVRQGSWLSVPSVAVPSLDSLQLTLDKWALARFLVANGLPHPTTELASHCAGSSVRSAALRFPVLLKPRSGGNGFGIRRFDGLRALDESLEVDNSRERAIVQTEITGYDIDCSVLCRDGEVLAYTIQKGFAASVGFGPPGAIEFVDDSDVIDVVRRLMAALRWNGVAHVDLRYDDVTGAVNIIEINPRFWGSVLGSLHAGINFPYLACLSALGRPFAAPYYRTCRYVGGATALGYWKRGRFARSSTGFSFTDTLFWYARHDPVPTLIEPFQKKRL